MIHLDTSFVVDLLREAAGSGSGPAHAMLERLADEELAVSVHVACELQAGAALARDPAAEREKVSKLLAAMEVVGPGEAFPRRAGDALAELQRRGEPVSTMDLLIACSALEHGAQLVTRNAREFDRIPGLVVLGY